LRLGGRSAECSGVEQDVICDGVCFVVLGEDTQVFVLVVTDGEEGLWCCFGGRVGDLIHVGGYERRLDRHGDEGGDFERWFVWVGQGRVLLSTNELIRLWEGEQVCDDHGDDGNHDELVGLRFWEAEHCLKAS
jgi:hypothetical protein